MARVLTQSKLNRRRTFARFCAVAAIIAPTLALSTLVIAGEEFRSPFEKSAGKIIRTAAQDVSNLPAPPPPAEPPMDTRSPAGEVPNQEYSPAVDQDQKSQDQNVLAERLRPITGISPFYDYSPDGSDPCQHLCPTDNACPADSLCPEEPDFLNVVSPDRRFSAINYQWQASNLYHNPLYFEDVQLERYGHVKCNEFTQPFVSMGKFGAQFVALPYLKALDNPHECRYALGYYRPGDCAPKKHYKVPLNAEAAVMSAPIYAGSVLLFH